MISVDTKTTMDMERVIFNRLADRINAGPYAARSVQLWHKSHVFECSSNILIDEND